MQKICLNTSYVQDTKKKHKIKTIEKTIYHKHILQISKINTMEGFLEANSQF